MKVWVEFPESTRFAKVKTDILYTPVYFANEGVHAFLKLDDEWQKTYNLAELEAKVVLFGRAKLGFLSIGGRPAGGFDTRYALPEVGFRPIYTLDILERSQTLRLNAESNRYPFSFSLPTATLNDVQQLASSLKIITSDAQSSMTFLKDISPALIVSVTYSITIEIQPEGQKKTSSIQEIRIFVGLADDQVPTITPAIVSKNSMAQYVTTQIVPLVKTKRRQSIPLIRRMSRTASFVQEEPYIIVEANEPKPFTFRRSDDAAATKLEIKLTYHNHNVNDIDPNPQTTIATPSPPPITASVQWLLRALTSLTLEPASRPTNTTDPPPEEEYFHLRSKILPFRKNNLTWSDWIRSTPSSSSEPARWTSTQTLWLTQPLSTLLPPSFTTPYLTNLYILSLSLNIKVADSARTSFGLGSSKPNVELSIPLQVRYELGLAPTYEIDESLPEYDWELPTYTDGGEDVGLRDRVSTTNNTTTTQNSNGDGTHTGAVAGGETASHTTSRGRIGDSVNESTLLQPSSDETVLLPEPEDEEAIHISREDDEVIAALMRRVAQMPVRRGREYGVD